MSRLTDDLGFEMDLADTVKKIISLVPSITEAIALTCAEKLIGCSTFCVRPANLSKLAGHEVIRVGGVRNPDLTKIKILKPDLVVVSKSENSRHDVEMLRAFGIPVWVSKMDSVPQAITGFKRLFVALQAVMPKWLRICEKIWQQPIPPVSTQVIVPIWRDPWMIVGPHTYTADLLARCGVGLFPVPGINWAESRYPKVGLAQISKCAADLILLPDGPYPFNENDGPECFTRNKVRLITERTIAWYGPALAEAKEVLTQEIG